MGKRKGSDVVPIYILHVLTTCTTGALVTYNYSLTLCYYYIIVFIIEVLQYKTHSKGKALIRQMVDEYRWNTSKDY